MARVLSTKPPVRPLWQRMLIRRLKFFGIIIALLALAFGVTYGFAPRWLLRADMARQAMAAHVETQTRVVGDTTWSYYEGGNGPTIVLLHGFASNKDVWLPLAKELTANFHVIAPDLPGWGDSTRIAGQSYNIDAQATRLDAFFTALGAKGFMLVGQSMGGAVAGVYAADHPGSAGSLVLVDSLGLTFKPNDFSREVVAGTNPFVFDDRAGFDRVIALTFSTPPDIPGRIKDVYVGENRRSRDFINSTFNELRKPDQALSLDPRLAQLKLPVLGLWCANDKVIDVSALDTLRNGLKSASAISSTILSGCNHMPMLEKPTETARVLTGFMMAR
jgi:pimeloyl-ACP methyl ester carboxylesterase